MSMLRRPLDLSRQDTEGGDMPAEGRQQQRIPPPQDHVQGRVHDRPHAYRYAAVVSVSWRLRLGNRCHETHRVLQLYATGQ